MKNLKIFFSSVTIIFLTYLFINNYYPTMRNYYFRGIQIIIEQIDSKPLKNKSFIKSKNFTKILKKSYKGIIAGGTGLCIAAKSIIDTSRKRKREEDNL